MVAICAAILPVAWAVWLARLFTSPATTAKPLPASPARAASIVAFRASRLVCPAMSSIRRTTSPIPAAVCASTPTRSAEPLASVDARSTAAAASVMRAEISRIEADSSSVAAASWSTPAEAPAALSAITPASPRAPWAMSFKASAVCFSAPATPATPATASPAPCSNPAINVARRAASTSFASCPTAAAAARRRPSSAPARRVSTAWAMAPISSVRSRSGTFVSSSPAASRPKVPVSRPSAAITRRHRIRPAANPRPSSSSSPATARPTRSRAAARRRAAACRAAASAASRGASRLASAGVEKLRNAAGVRPPRSLVLMRASSAR